MSGKPSSIQSVPFSKAVSGYKLYAESRHLSHHTIRDYLTTFRKFRLFLAPDDPMMEDITLDMVEEFFAGFDHLSNKTLLNYHTGLSAMWTWAKKRRIVSEHVVREYDPPKPGQVVIEIFTEEEVQKLLYACNKSASYKQWNSKKKCRNTRPTELRDKAIIMTLLDSMVRVSELCGMKRSELDLKGGRFKVFGKGSKERIVPISSETADVIWHYLAARPEAKPKYADLVFLTQQGRPMSRDNAGKMIARLGERVGVHAHPHKFRHTGATMFLRNGGDVFTLQQILGHTTMIMTRRYVKLAQVDIETAHRRASPVYNWDLRV